MKEPSIDQKKMISKHVIDAESETRIKNNGLKSPSFNQLTKIADLL